MTRRAITLLVCVTLVLGLSVLIVRNSLRRSLDYQHAMSLQREVVSFAVLHHERLPQSWDEFARSQGPTDWSLGELQKFGTLRWSWQIREAPPDGNYVYIRNARYRRFESEVNREILRQAGLR